MSGTFRLFRFAGADVVVTGGTLGFYALAGVWFWQNTRFLSNSAVFAVGAAFAVFLSVLLHELAHAAVARGFGYRVAQVRLTAFGGVTTFRATSNAPGPLAAIAMAGPLTNLLLWAAANAVRWQFNGVGFVLLGSVAWFNLALAVTNAFPGRPFDGARLIEPVLTRIAGDWRRAGLWACYPTIAAGIVLVALYVLRAMQGGPYAGLFLGVAGLVCLTGGFTALQQAKALARSPYRPDTPNRD